MDALRQLQQTAIVMEDFGANTEPSIEICREKSNKVIYLS